MMMLPTKEEWMKALADRHGEKNQKAFSEASVAVCGLGGLGSNIAISLARAGIGKLILIDFDRVDLTNLHRQQYRADQIGIPKAEALRENLLAIAPYAQIEAHTVRITEENVLSLLRGADVICEAFDDPECKAMLVNTVLSEFPQTYLIAASGLAGLDSANAIRTRRISERFYLCGDGVSEVKKAKSLVASRVTVCAGHQAHMVLRILSGQFDV